MLYILAQTLPTTETIVPTTTTSVRDIVLTIVGLIVVYYLGPLLRRKSAEADARAKEAAANKQKAEIQAGEILADRLKSFLWGSAAAIAEKRFPSLAKEILDGKLKNQEAVKAELRHWGQDLKGEAIRYFRNQDIDIIAEFGDEFVDKLIERAANAVSPFPGLETAKVILQREVSDTVIKKGVAYVKQNIGTLDECKGCIPVCVTCPDKSLQGKGK